MTMRSPLLQPLLKLFLETRCPLCQRSTPGEVCPDCEHRLQRCRLDDPAQLWIPPLPIFAWGAYQGALKRAIACLKYENIPALARPLGHWMGDAWLKSPKSPALNQQRLLVVPIPMYADKQAKRGYNQAELLAESFCEVTGLPLRSQGLMRIRDTQPQFGLSVTEREQNVSGSIRLGKDLSRRSPKLPVLLVDDIFTTGATARAAIAALRHHHIKVQGMITLARPLSSNEQSSSEGSAQL